MAEEATAQQGAAGKAEGFGDALKGAPIGTGTAGQAASAAAGEGAPAEATGTPAAQSATKPQPEAQGGQAAAQGGEAAAQPQGNQPASTGGVVRGIQAERRKRQAVEAENQRLHQQLAEFTGQQAPPAQAGARASDPGLENKLFAISENNAKGRHTDYDEKWGAFTSATVKVDAATGEVAILNKALYESVMDADDPAEAAYQAGIQLQLQAKYGTNTAAMVEAIRAEERQRLEAEVRAKVTAEMQGRAAEKGNQPTDILAGRAAGGGAAEVQQPLTFSALLGRNRRR